jgi:ABC-2 type transport system permease protein
VKAAFLKGVRKYGAVARIGMRSKLAYPAEKIGETIFKLFFFSLLFFLYRATLAHATTAQTEGLTLAQIMWTLLWVNIFSLQHQKGISHLINEEIQSGQIAYRINRPYSYLLFNYAEFMGEKIVAVFISGSVCTLFIYLLAGIPTITLSAFGCGIVMLWIGCSLDFLMQYIIGICGFWLEDTSPLRWIYKQAQSVAGGAVLPIALLPTTVKKIIELLPFAQTAYSGARIMIKCTIDDVIHYGTLQIAWLFILLLLAQALFNRGVRNVAVNGG